MELTKVVARYRTGAVIKGFTRNFFPNKDFFHISPPENPYGDPKGISMKDLKAVFFVRDFLGNAKYNERKRFDEIQKPSGYPMEVVFSDGEVLVGATLGYGHDRPGFFITPADPKSNNIKVFAVSSSVNRIRRL
jgi:hypothetical protein